MGGFSLWHILILAVLVLLLFGGNRFSAMMGDVAKGLKSFKKGMTDEEEQEQRRDQRAPPPAQLPPQQQNYAPPPHQQAPIDITPQPRDPAANPSPPPAQPPSDDSAR